MLYKCCVPQCRGNYDSTRKVRVFRFPHDEELCRKWVRAVPRENFIQSDTVFQGELSRKIFFVL